jgi:DNA-directed RNA polymerase specialized sigma24 family protein
LPDETLTPPLDERRAEEAALLLRILEKDERAIERLCERYSGPLYSVAYQVTGADRFAQNVVQDVFVAVWKDAGRFPSRGSLVGSP